MSGEDALRNEPGWRDPSACATPTRRRRSLSLSPINAIERGRLPLALTEEEGGSASATSSGTKEDIVETIALVRKEMQQIREEQQRKYRVLATETLAGQNSADGGPSSTGKGGGYEALEKYRGMSEKLTAQLEDMTRQLNEGQCKINRKQMMMAGPEKRQTSSNSLDTGSNRCLRNGQQMRRRASFAGAITGPLLQAAARLTPQNSARSIIVQSSPNEQQSDLIDVPLDPRRDILASLREELLQIEAQNSSRDDQIQTLQSRRDKLGSQLGEAREEQCSLAMEDLQRGEETIRLRGAIDSASEEVAQLRRDIEKVHKNTAHVRRSLAEERYLWDDTAGGARYNDNGPDGRLQGGCGGRKSSRRRQRNSTAETCRTSLKDLVGGGADFLRDLETQIQENDGNDKCGGERRHQPLRRDGTTSGSKRDGRSSLDLFLFRGDRAEVEAAARAERSNADRERRGSALRNILGF